MADPSGLGESDASGQTLCCAGDVRASLAGEVTRAPLMRGTHNAPGSAGVVHLGEWAAGGVPPPNC
jgi:hypothetical protein